MQIDAVITWVDSSDELWRNKINQYLEKEIDWNDKKESTRYSSINEIEVCILSILKFTSFIKNIYLITDNQQPINFLKLKKKAKGQGVNLELVDHTVIFNGYEQYLPTFNSQAIETMLYRIPRLSEHFVYFNDDMFLVKRTQVSDFFIKGKPVLRGEWIENRGRQKLSKRNIIKKKNEFQILHRLAKEKASSFLSFDYNYNFHHAPYPLRKSTINNFFSKNEDIKLLNLKGRYRKEGQYVLQGLANHIEIKNKSCVLEPNLSLVCIQSYTPFKINKKIKKIDEDGNVLFVCLQSLETAKNNAKEKFFKWFKDKLNLKL